ncbi:MAG: hypothetical protein JSV03_06170 [Planctomycetota bacterium]|nr:MAG: hypothetical protein JSV03_06170 [Planctomycetota bacterium]
MTIKKTLIRGLFASLLVGGTVVGIGCGDLLGTSIKNGLYNYITGSVTTGGVVNQFGDFVTDFFTGGFVGDNDNSI